VDHLIAAPETPAASLLTYSVPATLGQAVLQATREAGDPNYSGLSAVLPSSCYSQPDAEVTAGLMNSLPELSPQVGFAPREIASSPLVPPQEFYIGARPSQPTDYIISASDSVASSYRIQQGVPQFGGSGGVSSQGSKLGKKRNNNNNSNSITLHSITPLQRQLQLQRECQWE